MIEIIKDRPEKGESVVVVEGSPPREYVGVLVRKYNDYER